MFRSPIKLVAKKNTHPFQNCYFAILTFVAEAAQGKINFCPETSETPLLPDLSQIMPLRMLTNKNPSLSKKT